MSGALGHIYLVDDNEDIRKHVSNALIRQGYSVEVFGDAESFLRNFVQKSPAVILLDMTLPLMNGLDVFKKLQQLLIYTPVVYISGQSEPQEIIDSMKMGAHDFLWKPFSMENLLGVVRRALLSDELRVKSTANSMSQAQYFDQLTHREKEVCYLVLKGYGNKQIANLLKIQPDTAKKHRAKIMDKMQVTNLADLLHKLEGIKFEIGQECE